MKHTTFISAGAGSGKTFSLIQRILEYIKTGVCSADEIILTTFTKVAAAELLEKTRAALYKEKLYEEAERLENAAIGTIHSISYQMVARYWFLLHLSPDIRLIDEEDQKFYLAQSVATLPTDQEREIFSKVRAVFNIEKQNEYYQWEPDYDFWQNDLKQILELVSNFVFSDETLKTSEEESLTLLAHILQTDDNRDMKALSVEELKAVVSNIISRTENEAFKEDLQNALHRFNKDLAKYKEDMPPLGLCKRLAKKTLEISTKNNKQKELFSAENYLLEEYSQRLINHPDTYDLIKEYIRTIFSMALRWKKDYEAFKKQRRVIDFNDVQDNFLKLLNMDEVAEEIRSRYKVALVDEFQDCSPQQIMIFDKLSQLMKKSVWVGDIKQAIYNFRGTDSDMVKKLMYRIAEEDASNCLDTLKESWRSAPSIITLTNNVFKNVFSGSLNEEQICLRYPSDRKGNRAPEDRGLHHWHFNLSKTSDKFLALASKIKEVKEETGLPYKDFAVLCWKNRECDQIADAFERLGIPFLRRNEVVVDKESPVLDFLTSIVSVTASPSNRLSQALVAFYSEKGFTTKSILERRVKEVHNEEESGKQWWDGAELVSKLLNIANTIANQSIAVAVETIMLQLNIADYLKLIDEKINAYGICRRFIEAAATYEQRCNNLGLGCSMSGFVEYVKNSGFLKPDHEEGVVLSTYHKSKGLEWKVVVLSSLEKKAIERERIFFGIKINKDDHDSKISFIPAFIEKIINQNVWELIESSELYRKLYQDTIEENKRILYVGITRPKEMLVTYTVKVTSIASNGRKQTHNVKTDWPDLITSRCMNFHNRPEEVISWFDTDFHNSVISFNSEEEVEEIESSEWETKFFKEGSPETLPFEPQSIKPSRANPVKGSIIDLPPVKFNNRLGASVKKGEDATLGNCIHQLLCLYHDHDSFKNNVKKICEEYGVNMNPDDFMAQARALYSRLEKEFGKPTEILRETPFSLINDAGQEVNGEIDLIYRTSEGDVLIDYKTYSGSITEVTDDPGSKFYALKYSGQIKAYQDAISKAGYKVRDSLICYFNLGYLVHLSFPK